MGQYRFSPIQDQDHLMQAIKHVHFACYSLCKSAMGSYLSNAGNMGIFCHYDDEYQRLTEIRKELTEGSDNVNQKYFKLHQPIVISAQDDIPETIYKYLYIRKPDPDMPHVGDVDFFLEEEEYHKLKEALQNGEKRKGARVYDRPDLDMIELFDPDVDALGYISTPTMTEKVRVKQM